MLAAYGGLESACKELATAVSSPDATALASAGRAQRRDRRLQPERRGGTSLINDYYGQEPPIALAPSANPGS